MRLQDRIDMLRKSLDSIQRARTASHLQLTVQVTTEFLDTLKGILDLAENEVLTLDEWFVIYMALRSDLRGNPVHEELATKIDKFRLNRVQEDMV